MSLFKAKLTPSNHKLEILEERIAILEKRVNCNHPKTSFRQGAYYGVNTTSNYYVVCDECGKVLETISEKEKLKREITILGNKIKQKRNRLEWLRKKEGRHE